VQDFSNGGWIGPLGQRLGDFVFALISILTALPNALDAFEGTLRGIANSPSARSPFVTATLALVCAALLFVPGFIRRGVIRGAIPAVASGQPALAAVGKDVLDVLVTLALAGIINAVLFPGSGGLDQLAAALIWGTTRWRISMRGIDVLLRPKHPDLRLIRVTDPAARLTWLLAGLAFAIGLAFVSFVPVLLNHGLALPEARATALLLGTIDAGVAILACRSLGRGLGADRRLVYVGSLVLVASLWAVWIGSVVFLDFTFYDAYTTTLTYGWILVLIQGVGSLAASREDHTVSTPRRLVGSAFRRSIVVIAGVAGAAWILHDWVVDVFALVSPEQWPTLGWGLHLAIAVSLIGYVAFEALSTWSIIRFGAPRGSAVPGGEEDEHAGGSRLATTLPLLSRILLVLSIGMGVLLGLANIGINIGPLLAGAGIFGLAISFGSQALVRDIVSGFFFIVDDAFRVGEYIDTGRHKGSVERIALRSLRLRHQNGQVHTVPYGQIAAVTNFSRDWATVKFNLRLAPHTSIDLVRKTAKSIGQSLFNDPQWRQEFLVPLKLQGIADITDNAIVLRFKFTARPVRVTTVRREVIRRLYDALIANGVDFARTSVVVRSGDDVPLSGAGHAGAAIALNRDGPA
jgi:small-conductance mechanosensitive channel